MDKVLFWLVELGDRITAWPWEEILPYALGFLGGVIAMLIIDAIGGDKPMFEVIVTEEKKEENNGEH